MPIPIMERHLAESVWNTFEHNKLAAYLAIFRARGEHYDR